MFSYCKNAQHLTFFYVLTYFQSYLAFGKEPRNKKK